MRGSYIFFGLLACAVTTASGTTLPQDGHSGVRVPQLEARSLEQQTIKDGSAWSSGTRLAKRSSTARLGKRSDSTQTMLSNMRRYEQQLWAEFYDCVQYKIFSPTYPRRGAETAEEYNKMVEAECIEELGWTPEQYTELVQLRQARQARERGPESRGDNRPMQFSLPSTDDIGRFPGKVTESAKRYLFGSGASRGAAVQPNRPVFQRVRPR